jgi:hypothetical protein
MIKELSDETGISSQTLNGLKSTLEKHGASLDLFARSIIKFRLKLGAIKNDSDPAAQAIDVMGLNLNELRQADTDTFLKLLINALGKVENSTHRVVISSILFGKNFRQFDSAITALAR